MLIFLILSIEEGLGHIHTKKDNTRLKLSSLMFKGQNLACVEQNCYLLFRESSLKLQLAQQSLSN